jgi:transcriptional regulator with XRE-family HTH domain
VWAISVARRSDCSSLSGGNVTTTSGETLQSDTIRRAELGLFLRARRAAVAPEQAGMPRGKRRLTPGLRREEVAALANIGVTWYTWLEQGRGINVSAETLHRVANALSLSGSDEIYLFTLAGLPIPRDARRADLKDPASLQAVLDGFTTGPAVMFGPTFDVLGYNRVWNLIYAIDSYGGSFARNHVYRLFMDPVRRRLYVDYEVVARHMVGLLRAQYASHVGSPEFRRLLGALTAASPEFARLWTECHTQPLDLFSLRLQHETLGRLTLCASRFPVEGAPGLLIFFGTPEDPETAAVLARANRDSAKSRAVQSISAPTFVSRIRRRAEPGATQVRSKGRSSRGT